MRPRRRFEYRTPVVPVVCGECGCVHQVASCPNCGEQPDGVGVGVLQTEVVTEAGASWVVTAQRDPESGGWEPINRFPSPPAWGGRIEGEA